MGSPAYQVVDPSTGEVVETFEHASDEEVEASLARAAAAYERWRAVPLLERADVVRRVGTIFAERAEELAAIAASEMGKPVAK